MKAKQKENQSTTSPLPRYTIEIRASEQGDAVEAELSLVAEALSLLSDPQDAHRCEGVARKTRVNRVLCAPWHRGRLEDCMEKLAAGEKAPPIEVFKYTIGSGTLFSPLDGQHRAAAAREANHMYLFAIVKAENWCKPHQYALMSGHLWRKLDDNLKMVKPNVPDDQMELMIGLGVEVR